jgi:hypothetical protein
MKNAKAIRLIQKLLLRRITRPSAYSDRQSCPDHVLPEYVDYTCFHPHYILSLRTLAIPRMPCPGNLRLRMML